MKKNSPYILNALILSLLLICYSFEIHASGTCKEKITPNPYGDALSDDQIFVLEETFDVFKNFSDLSHIDRSKIPNELTTFDGHRIEIPHFIKDSLRSPFSGNLEGMNFVVLALERSKPQSRLNILDQFIEPLITKTGISTWKKEILPYGEFYIRTVSSGFSPLIIFAPSVPHNDLGIYAIPLFTWLWRFNTAKLTVVTPDLYADFLKFEKTLNLTQDPVGNQSLISLNRTLIFNALATTFDTINTLYVLKNGEINLEQLKREFYQSLIDRNNPRDFTPRQILRRYRHQLILLSDKIEAIKKSHLGKIKGDIEIQIEVSRPFISDQLQINSMLEKAESFLEYQMKYNLIKFGLGYKKDHGSIIQFIKQTIEPFDFNVSENQLLLETLDRLVMPYPSGF